MVFDTSGPVNTLVLVRPETTVSHQPYLTQGPRLELDSPRDRGVDLRQGPLSARTVRARRRRAFGS